MVRIDMTESIRTQLPVLPVSHVLPDIDDALINGRAVIVCAPPGAGKTTLIPLYLLDASWRGDGRIILLEPRRLAARAAASRMASLLDEDVGGTVGYRMRLDSKITSRTRIEVVTEGVFARMVLDDPELSGIAVVLFDEFHERSLDGDTGLALALDVQAGLREDLRIVVMSATLDVGKVSGLIPSAPVIESLGRSYPVDILYKERPVGERIEDTMARSILEAHREHPGSILAFLPGQAEIRRTAERLEGRIAGDTLIAPLYGNLSQREQDAAIRPARDGTRKIVLATSIAETSITIDGVRIVIDSGLQRLPVFEPSTGMTRLETVRVSRASADQRAGRAGRTEPGIAIRLWHEGQNSALPAFTPPQIMESDLSGLILDLAHWGVDDPARLPFIDQPPIPAVLEAKALLKLLDAIDDNGRLTRRGEQIRALALPPRLAAMCVSAAEDGYAMDACMLAVLLSEQGLGGTDVDLESRLRRFRTEKGERSEAARQLARRMAKTLKPAAQSRGAIQPGVQPGALLIRAYPDRIALQRGGRGRFVMANGRGAEIDETERLAASPLLVIADVTGRAGKARLLAAAEISRADIDERMPDAIVREDHVVFDRHSQQVRARRITRLGAIVFEETPLPVRQGPAVVQALAEGVRDLGLSVLPFSKDTAQLRERIGFLNGTGGDGWPDMRDEALLNTLDVWFTPFQTQASGISDISASGLSEGVLYLVPPELRHELTRLAPTHFQAPTGQRHPIRYDGDEPVLSIRVQELFGLTVHPVIGADRRPLLLELLSPAHRLIQTTRNLPGFWTGSWKDVRADMRGRYPRHPWPEDPATALPTTRVKPRGT